MRCAALWAKKGRLRSNGSDQRSEKLTAHILTLIAPASQALTTEGGALTMQVINNNTEGGLTK